MSNLAHRSNTILKANSSDSTRPDFASGYTVTAYEAGAIANGAQTSNTITVHAGHQFAAGDKFIVSTDTAKYHEILSVTSTVLTLANGETVTVADEDKIVNLGVDTGTTAPSYDGSGLTIYSDPVASSAISESRVTCSATGGYEYWKKGSLNVWELVRDGDGTPVGVEIALDGKEIFDVKEYGAVGNNANDDTTAIQAAIDDAEVAGDSGAPGAVVFFPPGRYIITDTLTLPRSGSTPTDVVHLVGSNMNACYIKGSGMTASTGMIEWEATAEQCRRQVIKNLSFTLPTVSGCSGIKFVPTDKSTAVAIRAETLELYLENVLLQGNNQYHTELLDLQGNLKLCSFVNVIGDANIGTFANDIHLFKFDSTPYSNVGQDEAGCNYGYFENVTCGFRAGGRVGLISGRINQCVINRMQTGVGLYSDPVLDLTNCSSCRMTNITIEAGGEQPQISLNTCHYMVFENLQTGSPSDKGGGVGNAIELVASSDNRLISRSSYSGSASYTGSSVKYVTLDASSDRNHFTRIGLNDTLANEITDSGADNYFESYNHATSAKQYDGLLNLGETKFHGMVRFADISTFSSADATPSVAGGNVFITNGNTTITDFDDGIEGQVIYVVGGSGGPITINDGGNLVLAGNFAAGSADMITLVKGTSTYWYEISRSNN